MMRSRLKFLLAHRSTLTSLTISLLGGILMGLTPAPGNLWGLAWIALSPLWVQVISSARLPIFPALFWGLGYHGLALFWVTGIHPMTWLGVPWIASLAIAFFCWLFVTLWGAILVVVWASLFYQLQRFLAGNKKAVNSVLRLLFGIALWCILEGIWSQGSLWWSSLSYTQSPYNLIVLHLGQLSGPNTVTAALVLSNGLIAEAWLQPSMTSGHLGQKSLKSLFLSLAIACFIFAHSIGFYLYQIPRVSTPETSLKVGVIQGNIPNEIKLDYQGWRKALEGYTIGYKTLADQGAAAILTPETALPFLWTKDNQRYSSFYQAVLEKNVLAWVGAFGQIGDKLTNSLFTLNGSGEIISQYDKIKLVPLGEFIPFEEFLGKFIDRLSPLDAKLAHGDVNQIVETPFGQAIVGICYDSTFAEVFRRQAKSGGQFILTASNDAHYSAGMQIQHHAQDVMRAIELDRWAVRATNTGISGIIDPHGHTLWMSDRNVFAIHAETIYRRTNQTLFTRWGDWLTPTLIGLAVMGVLFQIRRKNHPSGG